MTLPVRPSSSSQDLPPDNQQPNFPSLDASISSVAQPASRQTKPALPHTLHKNSTTMCGPVVDSSPLSSPISPLSSPPGAWPSVKDSKLADEAGPITPKGSAADISNDSQINDLKEHAKPASPSSVKSNMSKKRARTHDDDEPAPTPKKAAKKAAKQPKPSAAPTRSSGRNRKATERFTGIEEPSKKKPAPARKPASKVFDPIYITTNANSRLCKSDVYHMLLTDSPWTCLTVEQKQELFAMLPKTPANIKLVSQIVAGTVEETTRPWEFNQNFNLFRTDVAKFLEDLRNGHLGKSWQAAAEQAIIERAEGKFDEWKAEEAEAWWGQK